MGCLRALASPVARVGFAPLPNALDLGRACEVIAVGWLVEPPTLAGGFAGVVARGLGAVALASSAARVGIKKGLTVLTLALAQGTSHWPEPPQANDPNIAAGEEEHGAENGSGRRAKKTEEREERSVFWEEDGLA